MNGIVTLPRALAGVLTALPMLVFAAPSATVTVKVTVVAPPPCVINDGRPIEVEFGDVMTTRVDGDNYKMPVNYTLSCTGDTANAMKLQIKAMVPRLTRRCCRPINRAGYRTASGRQQTGSQQVATFQLPKQARIVGDPGETSWYDPDGRGV